MQWTKCSTIKRSVSELRVHDWACAYHGCLLLLLLLSISSPSTMLLLLYCWTLRRREKHDVTKLSHLGLMCTEHFTLTAPLVTTGKYSLNSAGIAHPLSMADQKNRLFLSDSWHESGVRKSESITHVCIHPPTTHVHPPTHPRAPTHPPTHMHTHTHIHAHTHTCTLSVSMKLVPCMHDE